MPSPNCPDAPSPQHITVPPTRRAQAKLKPIRTCTASVMPLTETGVGDDVMLPSPSWPAVPRPQQSTPPVLRTTHVDALPQSRSIASWTPVTTTGAAETVSVLLSPSWLFRSEPQHLTVPFLYRAHV